MIIATLVGRYEKVIGSMQTDIYSEVNFHFCSLSLHTNKCNHVNEIGLKITQYKDRWRCMKINFITPGIQLYSEISRNQSH